MRHRHDMVCVVICYSEASAETPLEILKRRYASGEITKEEFLEMKEVLSD